MTSNAAPANPQKTKKQHYVPQFILRKFSPDDAHISMVLLSSRKVIPGAQIATQCQERYFYGEDQVIEKAFAQDENQIAPILSDLSVERLRSMTEEDLGKLIGFTYFQQARTRGSAEGLNATTTALAQEVMRATAAVNGDDITEDEIQGLRVGYERAQDHALMMAVKMWPIFSDLAAKFIVTDRTPGFLIGDHPVVFNNQYIEHKENLKYLLGITGLATKGLQAFLPLSPSVTLAIYDPVVYEYGSSSLVCRAGPDDVAFLNELQAAYAFNALYFDPVRMPTGTLEALVEGRKNGRSAYSRDLTKVQGPGHIFAVSGGVKLGKKLSFVKHRDNHSYLGYNKAIPPVRSAELLDEARKNSADVEAKRAALQTAAAPKP